MIRYLETFYRHRLVLVNLLVLSVVVAVLMVMAQPRSSESSAKIWLDAPVLTSAGAQSTATTADQSAAVLKELLRTHAFSTKVGARGGLADALAATPDSSGGILSRAQRMLARFGFGRILSRPQPIDERVYDTLNKDVKVESDGPQVVTISFHAASAEVAQGTVQALLDQFSDEILSVRRAQSKTVVDFFAQQVKDQQAALSAADMTVSQYLAAHPQLRGTDTTLLALQHAADLARQRYQTLVLELDQAKLDQTAQEQAGAGFRVIDPPGLALSGGLAKTVLRATVGGLAAGLMLTLFFLLALTAADTSLRRPEEVSGALGLRLVGTVPRFR
jgi:uncharacterized protein involved in exopolysaccharide biosynthesis